MDVDRLCIVLVKVEVPVTIYSRYCMRSLGDLLNIRKGIRWY